MEKWIGPYESDTLFGWMVKESAGDIVVFNKASYNRSLSQSEIDSIMYWLLRGVPQFQITCCFAFNDNIKEQLSIPSKAHIAMIGDVSAYELVSGFLRGKDVPYLGTKFTYSSLSEPRRELIADMDLHIAWVRPELKDKFPLYPVTR